MINSQMINSHSGNNDVKIHLRHLRDNDTIILTILDIANNKHSENKIINKKKGEEYIKCAKIVEYQDNDFFGRISLYGLVENKDIVYSLLFYK